MGRSEILKAHRLRRVGRVWHRAAPPCPEEQRLLAFAERFASDPTASLAKISEGICHRNFARKHLTEAIRRGYLQLSVNYPRADSLNDELVERFGLLDAEVVYGNVDWEEQDEIRGLLAPVLMQYLHDLSVRVSRHTKQPVRIGVDGGKTLFEAANLHSSPPDRKIEAEIIPLLLGPLEGTPFTSGVVGQLLATRMFEGAVVRDEFGPVRAEIARGKGMSSIRKRLARDRATASCDVVLVGIGAPEYGILHSRLENVRAGLQRDVVGDICSLAFNARGEELECFAHDGFTLVSLKRLGQLAREESYVVAAAGGRHKVSPIRVAIERGFVNTLITDTQTAEALLSPGDCAGDIS